MESGTTIDLAKKNVVLTRNSKYEGLSLPDVDTSDQEVIGRVYTWKEIIAIDEDSAEDNQLKKALSKGEYICKDLLMEPVGILVQLMDKEVFYHVGSST